MGTLSPSNLDTGLQSFTTCVETRTGVHLHPRYRTETSGLCEYLRVLQTTFTTILEVPLSCGDYWFTKLSGSILGHI